MFPELVQTAAGVDAAQSQDVFGAGFGPEHARLFAPGTDHGFTTGLDHARADEIPRRSIGALLHPAGVAHEIAERFADGPSLLLAFARALPARLLDQVLNLVLEQSFGPATQPFLLLGDGPCCPRAPAAPGRRVPGRDRNRRFGCSL